jgi:outer membrane protein assembly factor BamB
MAATTSQVFVSDADSNVWSFDEGTGAVDWKQAHLLGRKITGPVIYNGNLVVADGYGYLHFMSLADGHFVERIEIGAGALAKPIVYRGNLYVYTASGDLIALHAS